MKRRILLILTSFIAMTCVTSGYCAPQVHNELQLNEVDKLAGQWNYDLITKDGTKIKGFFQVQPSSKNKLTVIGQAYFDKGTNKLSTKNLRGVWTGSLQKDKREQNYILTFKMQSNSISSSNTHSESPYHGTIYFHQEKNTLNGKFFDHGLREGVNGTITAYKRLKA